MKVFFQVNTLDGMEYFHIHVIPGDKLTLSDPGGKFMVINFGTKHEKARKKKIRRIIGNV